MLQNKIFRITLVSTALTLIGCGGGSGYFANMSNSTDQNNNSGTGSTISDVNISAIALLDANGKATNTISAAGGTAKVKVTDKAGVGIAGALVTFRGTGVTFGSVNGAVITNAEGETTISVKPSSATDNGAYQLNAVASANGKTATASPYVYSLQAANIVLSTITTSGTDLASGGSANLTLTTTDGVTNTVQNNIPVTFTAGCGTFTAPTVVSSSQGNVTNTYKAVDNNGNLCEGVQKITAITTTGAMQSITFNIAAIQASSIVYTTSNDVALVTKGSGSATQGLVEFTVYANGVPATNQNVNISLTRAPSDLSLNLVGLVRQITLTSDAKGKVTVPLYPGSLPGPVEITAVLATNPTILATSKNVSVATGRVYQKGLSLSASKYALQNYTDGDSTTITARMTDRVGNPVPDGTVISFVSEGGSITPSCASVNGICNVTLTVQNPRPSDNRVTVLAYVEGDKAYTDTNGNNMWDQDEPFTDNIGDFFRDDDENNFYNAGEFIYTRGESGGSCGESSFYQPNKPNTCGAGLSAILRQQVLVTFADKVATIVGLSDPIKRPIVETQKPKTNFNISFSLFGSSAKTTAMPTGTTVAVRTVDNSKDNLNCTAEIRSGVATVQNAPDNSTPNYTIAFKECGKDDDFKLTITSPNDLSRTYTYTIN